MVMAVSKISGMIGVLVAMGMSSSALYASQLDSCRFEVPTDLDAAPARWLGACQKGTADGLGIVRAGTSEPYAFFAGRMKGGRPVEGLLILREGGWMAAFRFDAALHVINSDGLKPEEDDRVFAQAQKAAMTTSESFYRKGNGASADYYARLARRITEGRPE